MTNKLLNLLRKRYPNWSEEVLLEHVKAAIDDIKECEDVL